MTGIGGIGVVDDKVFMVDLRSISAAGSHVTIWAICTGEHKAKTIT